MDVIEFNSVTTSVRPHRLAVLINSQDKHWKAYVESIITAFSKTWGGENFVIIPTDGKIIHDKFWHILEEYSPDTIAKYIPNIADLELAMPEYYANLKERHIDAWLKVSGMKEAEEEWSRQRHNLINYDFEVHDVLKNKLINRLSPFHHQGHVVQENISGNSFPGYPFTNVYNINKKAQKPFTRITVPPRLPCTEMNLLSISKTGYIDTNFLKEMSDSGLEMVQLPDAVDMARYVEYVEENDGRSYTSPYLIYWGNSYRPPKDFSSTFPFRNSMLHLGGVYKIDKHKRHRDELVLVIGDTIEDFCLYYCLSRVVQGISWMPDELLHDTYTHQRKKPDTPYSEIQSSIAQLVHGYSGKLGNSNSKKSYKIVSMSLSKNMLVSRKKWMKELVFTEPEKFGSRLNCVGLDSLRIECVHRIVEIDNFFNRQDMIFKSGNSIGKVQTPKPKNFSSIDPNEHRWITTLDFENHSMPPYPFLSDIVFNDLPAGFESRIGADGPAYFCPSPMVFSPDIDSVILRPQIKLLSDKEFFDKYFEMLGYESRISDKGSYMRDTIAKFGHLHTTATFFKREAHREVMNKYLLEKKVVKERRPKGVIYLDVDNRAYLAFEAFEESLNNEKDTIQTLDSLVSKNVLFRGFILWCENCRRTDWYGLEDVGRTFTCKRCELTQEYNLSKWKWSKEPKIYYKLAETVYQFYRSSSHVTAIALNEIRKESKESFQYTCETEIVDKNGLKKEIDIICTSNGRLILGECKDTRATEKELGKYVNLYRSFKYKPHGFVLATTESKVSERVSRLLSHLKNPSVLTSLDIYGG